MSNDPAMVKSNFDRVPMDFYPTPSWITKLICDYIEDQFPNIGETRILEPSCGEGHMSKVMEERGFSVDSYDLVNRGYGIHGVDFLQYTHDMSRYDGIVTNPPYGDTAKAFIRRGLNLIEDEDKFMIMVLRNEFDCGVGVTDLFGDCPMFHSKVVLTKRPVWVEKKEGEKTASPRHNYSFYVWHGMYGAPPVGTSNPSPSATLRYAHPAKGII